MYGGTIGENVKVLIVGQSSLNGLLIAGTLQSDPNIKIVDMCKDNADIIEKINSYKPDVMTIDAKISDEGGMKRLEKIVGNTLIPVVVLGKKEEKENYLFKQAFDAGTAYFVDRPDDCMELISEPVKKELIKKVHTAKNLKYNLIENSCNSFADIFETSNYTLYKVKSNLQYRNEFTRKLGIKNIVAIGTSTGGPKALLDVIPMIPKNLSAAYLIVQHMPSGFTRTFAQRLDGLSKINVKEAEDKEIILEGTAYIAPGGYHMLVEKDEMAGNLKVRLSDIPPKNSVRPSADVLFNSLAETELDNLIGIIMTGMGCDGREGLINMKKRNNAHIIAESEDSCTVYGMPKAVINAGIADRIVPVEQITNEIIKYVGVHRNGYESIH